MKPHCWDKIGDSLRLCKDGTTVKDPDNTVVVKCRGCGAELWTTHVKLTAGTLCEDWIIDEDCNLTQIRRIQED